MISACYGGLGPGLLTAVMAIFVLDYFFIPPLHTLTLGFPDFLRLCVFAAVAIVTSSLSARLKETKADLVQSHDELEMRVRQRTEELSRVNTNLTEEIAHRREAEKEILEISNREQRRLGQDLHDGLCQILAGVRLMSENLKERLIVRSAPESADVEKIESRLDEALAQADMVSRGLYPVELDTNGLAAALDEMVRKISALYPVACRFISPKEVTMDNTTAANHLYRIAQEAVMNAIKGGKARQIHVRLRAHQGRVILSVAANGTGIRADKPRNGMGIKIMHYRARMINATLKFQSRSGGGTRVSCSFEPDSVAIPITGESHAV